MFHVKHFTKSTISHSIPSCAHEWRTTMNKSSQAHWAYLNLDRLRRWTFIVIHYRNIDKQKGLFKIL
jgi:hypothetical protein